MDTEIINVDCNSEENSHDVTVDEDIKLCNEETQMRIMMMMMKKANFITMTKTNTTVMMTNFVATKRLDIGTI